MICDFCHRHLFAVSDWGGREARIHHTKIEHWEESVAEPCSICVGLLETVERAFRPRMERPRDWLVRRSLVRDVLKCVEKWMPLFEAVLEEEAARDQFKLIFRPTATTREAMAQMVPWNEGEEIRIPEHRFLVYSVDSRLRPSTADRYTLAQIQQWLRECRENHSQCRHLTRPEEANTQVEPPTRLLDLGLEDQQTIRIVETNGERKYCEYFTLSHCWGGALSVLCLNRSNKADFTSVGIPLDNRFPRSFREAIEVARALGARYLWIDSLCIVQTGDDGVDWHHEAHKMAQVYGASQLNIAAASARRGTEGLFRERRTSALSPSTIQALWKSQERLVRVVPEDFWARELLGEKLFERTWVVQERLLAPRMLSYGSRQVFWQCLATTACETMPHGVPAVLSDAGHEEMQWRRLLEHNRPQGQHALSDADRALLQRVWREAVRTYSSCDITKKTDKLPAIAGLAEAVASASGEFWVAGLWNPTPVVSVPGQETLPLSNPDWDPTNQTLVEQLAWRVVDCRSSTPDQPSQRQLPNEYRSPSWGWPSVDGIIDLAIRVRLSSSYSLRILEPPRVEIMPYNASLPREPSDAFERLKSGSLRARGLLWNMPFRRVSSEWQWHPAAPEARDTWCFLYPDEQLTRAMSVNASDPAIISEENDDAKAKGEEVLNFFVLPLSSNLNPKAETTSGRALALRSVSAAAVATQVDGKAGEATFSRLGLVEWRNVDAAAWGEGGGEERSITLI